MLDRFFQRRSIWWPNARGWALLLVLLLAPPLSWFFFGERFFSQTHRLPGDVLIVEGWIGLDGVRAAKDEFDRGDYRYVVTAGGLTEARWDTRRWNYGTEAAKILIRLGVPADRVIPAPAPDTTTQRTFTAAFAVNRALAERGVSAARANVFTESVHARRSRLVYAKALPATEVGVISWRPQNYESVHWWRSSERAIELIKESVGYLYELLLNSGRLSNSTLPTKT
jgi:hypothetical protein